MTIKRLIFIFAAMAALVSCFQDEYTTTQSYTLNSTFEYNSVAFASDSTFFDVQYGHGLGWYDLLFSHKVDMDSKTFCGGFMLSQQKASAKDGLDGKWRVALGSAAEGSAGVAETLSYLVFYDNPEESMMPEHDVVFVNRDIGTCTPAACYVTNTAFVAESVRSCFEAGDRLTLKATGYLNGSSTGSAEIALADFSAQKDSVVTAWTLFDLSELGSVEYVDFEVSSTKDAVPAYFCMDCMITNISLKY